MFNFANMWVPVAYAVLLIILGGATWLLLGIFKKPSEATTKEDKKASAAAKKQAKLDAKNLKKNSPSENKPAFTKAKASAFPEPKQKHVFGETGDTISLGGEVSENETAAAIEEVDANSILGISSSKTKASRAEDAIIPSSLFDRLSDDD